MSLLPLLHFPRELTGEKDWQSPPTTGQDHRRGKHLLWREARLCLARPHDSATPRYGATLGSGVVVGHLWRATARVAGLSEHTRVHGVGDGAEWILTQFQEQFGRQGNHLVDFYHVSEYLAAAAAVICPKHPKAWRHRQQGPLLENKMAAVVRALAAHLEAEHTPEAPVARRTGIWLSAAPIWTMPAPAPAA